MKWTMKPLGPIQTNCYILEDETTRKAIIIDPSDSFSIIDQYITRYNLKPIAVLLTHAHFDHIGALDDVRNTWHIPSYLHKAEQDWTTDPDKNGSSRFPIIEPMRISPVEHIIHQEQHLSIGPFECEVFETPGHSPGSVSYYFSEDHIIFSGDALFNGSIGRTDLFGGNQEQLLASIKDRLFTLPGETIVAPGHGTTTTIEKEKNTNPFLT
ncbi:MBL fold metallo-hydrolase [Terrilactibacillus laevilacticus]|uniref:MBL fold metallo-hydrolase n=1 Tax=Terrilactibacillus laevilacticus TaxID=1380157 RepID=A0ABW5PTN4_9BACI|nr:MBL fold metallo-hydrolase [Terrilactibacillus laevilacticus]